TGPLFPQSPRQRRYSAVRIRARAIHRSKDSDLPKHRDNGDEAHYLKEYGFPVANFSKGLPHNPRGEAERHAYEKLLYALRTGRPEDYGGIPLANPGGRPYVNPQSALAFELEGVDPQGVTIPPAPRFDSRQNMAEMVELYWMALLRDVPFTGYGDDKHVAAAAAELEQYRDVFDVPHVERITPDTLFRGRTSGDLRGPYLSQFLLHDVPLGSLTIPQRQSTVIPGADYMTRFDDWLAVQNGVLPGEDRLDATPRYLRNLRDLARYVHVDQLYQAYLNAALLLLDKKAPVDPGNPYVDSPNQEGFGTFGGPALLALLPEVSSRALKAVWSQKWNVHRRLRPEEYGGRIEVARRGDASYPVGELVLSSKAHQRVLSRYGSSLLPQAFPEGSPMHPAYGAGHATVAGACVTLLKAWFDTRQLLCLPTMVPSADGTTLVPYQGPDANTLTVGDELDKLAANISIGRNGAGVHWRTDYTESIRLGERITLEILQEVSLLPNEQHAFELETFDGQLVRIEGGGITRLRPVFPRGRASAMDELEELVPSIAS
ncbi:MAG TPA: vanadium-dependent haloperoxidase, partial [Myxococcaceae bacterium]|nr:vanadium-dependent haloperoxidase [Myxococcaceae bacterium]